jgi:hypothetical protein
MLKRTVKPSIIKKRFAKKPAFSLKKHFSHNTISQQLLNAVEDGEIDALEALDACMAEMFDEDIQRVFEELCGDSVMMARKRISHACHSRSVCKAIPHRRHAALKR